MQEFKFNNTGIVNVNTQAGNQIGHQHNYSARQASGDLNSLNVTAEEIRRLLIQLSSQHSALTEADKLSIATQAKQQIEQQQPSLRTRIVAALKAGSVEALKQACQHPVAEVTIATFEGWVDP
jgi:DNA-binding transcriptional MerR regulator